MGKEVRPDGDGKIPLLLLLLLPKKEFQFFPAIVIAVARERKPRCKKLKRTEQVAKLRFEFSWL